MKMKDNVSKQGHLPMMGVGPIIGMCFCSNFISKIDGHIKENHLVITGVYAIVRNPIYSAFFLVCIGAILIESNIILFVLPLVYLYMTVFC